MKKYIIMLTLLGMMGLAIPSYASDWDTAGKILTGIEGMRVLTGGQVDIIGSITGINNNRNGSYGYRYDYRDNHRPYQATRVWVSRPVYEQKWVPAHNEYRSGYGWIYVEGHYENVYVGDRGYWVTQRTYADRYYGHRR